MNEQNNPSLMLASGPHQQNPALLVVLRYWRRNVPTNYEYNSHWFNLGLPVSHFAMQVMRV